MPFSKMNGFFVDSIKFSYGNFGNIFSCDNTNVGICSFASNFTYKSYYLLQQEIM